MRALGVFLAGAIAAVVLVTASACHENSIVNPPKGPGCGWDVDCNNGMCCPFAHICGGPNAAGFQRCEPGFCCYDGDPLWGSRADAGPRNIVPMRRAQ